MRRFALGVLGWDPERFGKTIIGDFFDAMWGWNEEENERRKAQAELIRTSTWLLWNLNAAQEYKTDSPEALWRLPWDESEGTKEQPTEKSEEQKAFEERQKQFLLKKYPD